MPNVEKHKRENDILLGFLERPALQWLAEHAPAWVTPDGLTSLGMGASVLIFISYALTNISPHFLWLASLGFILNWLGDSLDGTLARHRHIERPRYGFMVDHWIDAMSTVLIFVGLGLSPYVDLVVACFGAIMYLLLSIMVYLVTYVTGVFRITSAKIGPTEIRGLAVILNTVIFFVGNPLMTLPYFGATSFYSLAVALVVAAMGIYFLVNGAVQSRRLMLLDEKRLERRLSKEKEEAKKKQSQAAKPAASES